MRARLDHLVLWVDDPSKAVAFYERVVGLAGVRVEEYTSGAAPFPSVRVNEVTIIDLMARPGAETLNAVGGMGGSAGHRLNHVCLSLSRDDFAALRARLAAEGVAELLTMDNSFGAQGFAPAAFYFADPDGNVLEARYYDDA